MQHPSHHALLPEGKPEILAPAGGRAQLEAAVWAGADAVYFGLDSGLNARVRATSFAVDTLAATMDYLSEGRLEFGIGAGWIRAEYDAIGLPFDEFPQRFERCAEFVHAYKAFMAGEALSIAGDFINWSGFSGIPAPAQRPWPPLMIGGGSRKILGFAGQEADIVSLNFNNRAGMLGPEGMNSGVADATAKKIQWVKDGAGSRFGELELEIGAYNTIVTDHQGPTAAAIGEALGMSADDILHHPHCLIGSVDYMCEELERRRETYGISYIAVLDDGENNMVEAFAPVVKRLAGK